MGFRFRKTVKIGGVRVNLGKSGITSIGVGGRGNSFTIGRRGVYHNLGVPGTGLSYRNRLDSGGARARSASRAVHNAESASEPVAVDVRVTVEEDGTILYRDLEGNHLPDEMVSVIKKQNRQAILGLLEQVVERINERWESLVGVHLNTPSPDAPLSFIPDEFTELPPVAPDKAAYKLPRPEPPVFKKKGLLASRIGLLGDRIDQQNAALQAQHQENLAQWEREQATKNRELAEAQVRYARKLDAWESEKQVFEAEQARRRWLFETGRFSEPDAMQEFLEERLGRLEWPLDTMVSFDVAQGGEVVLLDVDLPEIEAMPSSQAKVNSRTLTLTLSERSKTQGQKQYLHHIHAIAFRLVGETFQALPNTRTVVISGYSQRHSRRTGHIEDEYLFSMRVDREGWRRINFERLDVVDVVACFDAFETRRQISKSGVITPIIPFDH